MKKIAIASIIMLFLVTTGVATEDFTVIPPSSGAPDWMVLLSGKWAGEWVVRTNTANTYLVTSTLIFQEVFPDSAKIVYTAKIHFSATNFSYKEFVHRTDAKIVRHKRSVDISFDTPNGQSFLFTLTGGVLTSQQKQEHPSWGWRIWNIVMKKTQ